MEIFSEIRRKRSETVQTFLLETSKKYNEEWQNKFISEEEDSEEEEKEEIA